MSKGIWKIMPIKDTIINGAESKQRNMRLSIVDIGKTVKVYDGRKYVEIRVQDTMVGLALGDFAITRRLGGSIHNKKLKRKNKKK